MYKKTVKLRRILQFLLFFIIRKKLVFKERIDSGNTISMTDLNVEGTVNIALYVL